jgi:hypothetical protein
MARATKKIAKKKSLPKSMPKGAKKITRAVKTSSKKVASKKLAAKRKSTGAKNVKTTTRSLVQSARIGAATAAETGKGIIRRAIDAVAEVAAPLLPGSASDKPKED